MMISCKQAAELVCQSLDRPLSLWEKVQLRFHLLMCRGCKGFMEQSRRLDELIEKHYHEFTQAQLDGLSEEACDRLKQKLREAAGHPPTSSTDDEGPQQDHS